MKKPRENRRYCFTITETLRKNVTIMAPFEDIARKRLRIIVIPKSGNP